LARRFWTPRFVLFEGVATIDFSSVKKLFNINAKSGFTNDEILTIKNILSFDQKEWIKETDTLNGSHTIQIRRDAIKAHQINFQSLSSRERGRFTFFWS
jgi:hypothetical protein